MLGVRDSKQIQIEQYEPLALSETNTPAPKKKALTEIEKKLDKNITDLEKSIQEIVFEFESYQTNNIDFVLTGQTILLENFKKIPDQTKKLDENLKKFKAMIYDTEVNPDDLASVFEKLEALKEYVEKSLTTANTISRLMLNLGLGPTMNNRYFAPIIQSLTIALDRDKVSQYYFQAIESFTKLSQTIDRLTGLLNKKIVEEQKFSFSFAFRTFGGGIAEISVKQAQNYSAELKKMATEFSAAITEFASYGSSQDKAVIHEKLLKLRDTWVSSRVGLSKQIQDNVKLKSEQKTALTAGVNEAFDLIMLPLRGYAPDIVPIPAPVPIAVAGQI